MSPPDSRIIAAIQNPALSEPEFNALALETLAHQFAHNAPYRRYCESLGVRPDSVGRWQDIPAVPQNAFKEFDLCTFPPQNAVKVFHTSGTTAQTPGRHFLETLDLYEISVLEGYDRTFRSAAVPPPETFAILAPDPKEAPHSSLSHMFDVWTRYFAPRGSRWFWQGGILDFTTLIDALEMAEQFEQPVFLMGTAFSFVHLFDECERRPARFKLPPGSLVLETGGYKGRSRKIPKRELYGLFDSVLGLPDAACWNEYGMTELGVQFYARGAEGLHTVPPWARVALINPSTGQEVTVGETGLVRIYDLTNRSSVLGIQTEDAAIRHENGFRLLGRISRASARGCSIAADDLLSMTPPATGNREPTTS
ncbi:MAG: long-chain fatty acid--CoA ligase [Verrucomicrobiae bacterium]|nr:long-chain fatty acid--CoA ligase [Verrucomicrobiae bacterium]